MIPINADIIHAAKIHMPPAKTFPCRGCSPYLLRNPSLQVDNVFALYRSPVHCNSFFLVPVNPLKHWGTLMHTFNH